VKYFTLLLIIEDTVNFVKAMLFLVAATEMLLKHTFCTNLTHYTNSRWRLRWGLEIMSRKSGNVARCRRRGQYFPNWVETMSNSDCFVIPHTMRYNKTVTIGHCFHSVWEILPSSMKKWIHSKQLSNVTHSRCIILMSVLLGLTWVNQISCGNKTLFEGG